MTSPYALSTIGLIVFFALYAINIFLAPIPTFIMGIVALFIVLMFALRK